MEAVTTTLVVTVTSVDGGTVVVPKNVEVETRTEEVLELVLVGAAVVVSTTVEVEMGTEGILELELVGTTTIVDVETGTEEVLELELVGTTTTVDVEIGTEEVLDLDLGLVGETVSVKVTKTVDVTGLFMFEEELLLETMPGCSRWEQDPKRGDVRPNYQESGCRCLEEDISNQEARHRIGDRAL